MEEVVFEVGQFYRNRKGTYEVLAITGDKMTIRYKDGSQQSVGIALQARIWANIQADEAPPPRRSRRPSDDEGLDTQPVSDLVRRVLLNIAAPYSTDIIDQVCLAIEQNEDWLQEYRSLVEHFSSQGKDGKLTVNSSIGWYVCDQTGMASVRAGNQSQTKEIIKSYSTLVYPQAGETILWQAIGQLNGKTLVTLDQKKPFDVSAIKLDGLVARPHASGKDRPLKRETFEGAWQELTMRGELSMTDVKARYSDWSPVYVTAILAEMPGVSYRIRPIVLLYSDHY